MLFRAYTWCIFLTMERHLGSRTSWLKRRRWSCCAPGSRDSQGRPSLSHEETGGSKTLELKADGDPVGLSADVGIVVLPDSKLTEGHFQACPYTQSTLRRGISVSYQKIHEAFSIQCLISS